MIPTETFAVSYEYNDAGRIKKITLPNGATVSYGFYQNDGRVKDVDYDLPGLGSPSTTLVDSIEYMPFGPMESWRYGNDSQTDNRFTTSGTRRLF